MSQAMIQEWLFEDSDYFCDLMEQIEEIRLSKRNFCQRLTDIYAQCSCDYDPASEITKQFYEDVIEMLLVKMLKRDELPVFDEVIELYLGYASQGAGGGKAICMKGWVDRMSPLLRFDLGDFERKGEFVIQELSQWLERFDHE